MIAVDGWSITAGYALLCCFGFEVEHPVSGRRLRDALVGLGYRPALARHLVRTSPLIVRERQDSYRLRPFQA